MRPLFKLHPALASLALAAVLAATNARYDYHRDELYFRMLDPAWGYADQPPLTPLLGRAAINLFGDSVWALRLPSVLCMVGALWLAALITRELGGGKAAQALCVWGLAFAGVALAFGHLLSTATVDLAVWTAALLFAIRALLRDPRWWLAVGAVAGVGLYNKHLIALLLLSVGVALLAVGPRRVLGSKWLWAGAALALVIGSPNLVYQAVNGWPQLEMASAIAEGDGAENRIILLPFQFVLLGTFLVPVWIAGIWALLRRPRWRPVRALAVAYPVLLAITLATGGQFYYPIGLLIALFAAGCVPAAAWAASRGRRTLLVAGVALNAAVSAVVALPLVPVDAVGGTPIPVMNDSVPDQIGWQAYTDQVEEVVSALPAGEAEAAVIITSNYGEAGALERYGEGLPPIFSGHNELHEYGPPPASATVVVTVGLPLERVSAFFDGCEIAAELDSGVDVENEEQGRTVGVCRGPVEDWTALWPRFQHYS
ncbi:glycosyltransferase family 39 protein [Glycomyces harbinensis]|uniref:Dolichyl-phosphate-mannose-protein mannosyltransferase n=1 Tax=Glycomyces harbinensis TaxID=58114 RepID=A0A1G6WQV6_9ACTN|nr:glycosyltransferase family 39 protein [Glycomyces harbinensis]SDD68169.1 Dolichyl-phosphate-mannose-protein mannosyltransferase [Glycomyces harbinensis]